ncbi:MAG: F0F1 ATP synthase subunit B [Deltaproteobacteria bacterium]|nr:F0F1 ATP synthase subunit B [Deltaproteobacteria bacterium]
MYELIPPVVNFSILIIVLVYFTRKPVKEFVANRQSQIRAEVEEARAQKLEAQRRYQEFTVKLKAFEAEAQQILSRAQTDGEAMRSKLIKDAQANADRIVKDAESTALSNIQEYKDQIRRETIATAVEMAEKVIRDRLSTDDQRRIVTEYVGKVQQK